MARATRGGRRPPRVVLAGLGASGAIAAGQRAAGAGNVGGGGMRSACSRQFDGRESACRVPRSWPIPPGRSLPR